MLEFRNVCKSFFGNKVLNDISFKANPGEILALIGQNGAGKSTLMKILSGIHQPDSGQILIDNKEVKYHGEMDVEKLSEFSIALVYQELSLVPHLSVSDNVVLGKDPKNKFHILDKKKQDKEVRAVLDRLGVDIDLKKKVAHLPASQQQLVEIAKCMYRNPKVVVFDEPTTSLTSIEREKLFTVMKKMKADGLTIIFISHYLDEVEHIADRCVALKDGEITYFGTMEGVDESKLISYMIGESLEHYYPELIDYSTSDVALELKGFGGGMVFPCDLKVNYGEVVGIGGLIGSGRTELMHMLIGAAEKEYGTILLNGKEVEIHHPSEALRAGIAYINEDRRIGGLNLSMSVLFNISLPSIAKGRSEIVRNNFFIKSKPENEMCNSMIQALDIKCNSPRQRVRTLSGGNQQKISVAKWIASEAKIYIFDEPTKGIDVLTKSRIYDIIRDLAKQGAAIIVISSYNSELIGCCDRIEVMSKGKFVASFGASASEHEILKVQ